MDTALLMLGGGIAAGVFGSLLGLGGGVLIVPILTLGFNMPLRDAVGVSLVCVIVNSGASAGVFLERRTANLRLGMLLELFTASGAIVGGLVAFLLDPAPPCGPVRALAHLRGPDDGSSTANEQPGAPRPRIRRSRRDDPGRRARPGSTASRATTTGSTGSGAASPASIVAGRGVRAARHRRRARQGSRRST